LIVLVCGGRELIVPIYGGRGNHASAWSCSVCAVDLDCADLGCWLLIVPIGGAVRDPGSASWW
jgi:hypothetical protein